jgi:hypothetical protein
MAARENIACSCSSWTLDVHWVTALVACAGFYVNTSLVEYCGTQRKNTRCPAKQVLDSLKKEDDITIDLSIFVTVNECEVSKVGASVGLPVSDGSFISEQTSKSTFLVTMDHWYSYLLKAFSFHINVSSVRHHEAF